MKPDSVSLLTVVRDEPPIIEVTAVYDADDPCTLEWAKRAEAVSGEVWQKLGERRKDVAR